VRVRRSFRLCVYGYVVMPEHVHLLLEEPVRETLADALKSLKQGVSRRLIGEAEHFWQKRYYDFNVRNEAQFMEKAPVYPSQSGEARALCAPRGLGMVEQLSSLRDRKRRARGDRVGMDGSKAGAGGGEARTCYRTTPLKPKEGLNGAPAKALFVPFLFTGLKPGASSLEAPPITGRAAHLVPYSVKT
jgi:Transposase IS200 like